MASQAAVPERPVVSSMFFNVAIAVALALLASLIILFVLEWWNTEEMALSE